MREDICSIPVSETFEPRKGCPVCRMRGMLEERMVTYIMGAAMMEPDVRVETNRAGFCERHLAQMRGQGNRLSLALLLETRLQYVADLLFDGKNGLAQPEKPAAMGLARRRAGAPPEPGCFVCSSIEKNMKSLVRNTVLLWSREPEFQHLYGEQEYFCLPHYNMLCAAAGELPKKERPPFLEVTKRLAGARLAEIQEDVTRFCGMFDYRNNGADWGNSRDAIERAIAFLTGAEPEEAP